MTQLRCFLTVADELHFGRAAARLHMSQSPLSRIIGQLERELGVALFERTTRSVHLTGAGLALVDPARAVIESCERAASVVIAAGRGEIGRVRVGFAGPSSAHLVARLVKLVHEAHQGIDLVLKSATFGRDAVRGLLDDDIDLAIVRWSVAPPGLGFRTVQRERYAVVVPVDHRLAGLEDVRMRDLRDERFVMLSADFGSDVIRSFLDLCYRAGYVPDIAQVAPDSWTLFALVAADVGITFSVDTAAAQANSTELRVLAVSDAATPPLAQLAWRQNDANPVVAEVLRIAEAALPTAL